MKLKSLLIGAALAAAVFTATFASAATFTTGDGVLSIETPSESWQQLSDPNYWFAVSDGANTITVDHLGNGESLPTVQVANANFPAVYQAFVSTQNEVFVVKGLAKSNESLQTLMETINTIKVLKFDTKKAVATPAPQASEFALRAINATYYVISDELNVRTGCSTDNALIGVLSYGDEVNVLGMVTKNGADYGWYQIQYAGTNAYVSASFLSDKKPSGSAQSSDEGKKQETENTAGASSENYEKMTVYAEDGRSASIFYVTSSGLWMTDDGTIFNPMAGSLYYGNETYWSADANFWASHTSDEFNYDEFVEETSPITDEDKIESSFTVYSENGNFKEITHYMPSDVYMDRHGLILEPMAGALFYEPQTGLYWDADKDYWKTNSSEDLSYDDFAEASNGNNDSLVEPEADVNVEGDNYDDAGYDDVDGDYVDGDYVDGDEDFEF